MPNRFEAGICGGCARPSSGRGFNIKTSGKWQPVIWVCDDSQCLEIVRATYGIKQDQFDRIESLAAQEGGNEGLWYLEDIGKTDLASLTIDEICEFKRRIVAGYRKALQAELKKEAAI